MKCKTFKVELPDYCLSYLVNGDSSGLRADEIINVDLFMDEYYDYAEELKGHVVIDVIDEEGSFNPFPEFGLACNTLACNINILY